MKTSLICAGSGGQGIMIAGQILSYTACDTTGKKVAYFPSYGMEKRGGTANCYVTISDEEISSPMPHKVDCLMAFNQASTDKFIDYIQPNGVLLVNTSSVHDIPQRDDIKTIEIDAGNLAVEIGSTKCLNLIMLGALIGYSEILPISDCIKTIHKKLGTKHPEMNPINEKAFDIGVKIGQSYK